ncbi:MAG: hypothetical protein K2Q12_04890 [Rickettsiales bacterium]|nr:hypothetical protein [Rickettsiales bacterium]
MNTSFFMHLRDLSLCVAVIIGAISCPALAGPAFNCPDLLNKEKISLDEMVQGSEGWFYRIKSDLQSPLLITAETQGLFARLATSLQQRGTALILAPVPPRAAIAHAYLDETDPLQQGFDVEKSLRSYRQVTRALREAGVLVPNLLKTTPPPQDMPADQFFFFKRDHHWTPYGARAVAQKIAETMKKTKQFAALKPAEFQTKKLGDSGWKPSMALEIQRLCSDETPAEPLERFETQRVAQDNPDDLFGDSTQSEPAVLVGSSFSAITEFNFDGFLMGASGIEIANRAISAGQQFNAIVSFVSSPAFETAHPPFLIWEMPSLNNISEASLIMFRQLIPATHGACSIENALASNKISIKDGAATSLLSVPAEKKVTGNQYYLYLTSSNLGLAKFTLQMDYDDEDGEWFTVDRSQHFDNSGRFFVELSDEIEGNLTAISIDGMPNTNAEMEVRLCQAPKATGEETKRTQAEQ